MTDSTGSWQPDPHGRHQYRWWDGSQWTDQVANDGVTSTDVPDPGAPPPPGVAAAPPSEPEPTGVSEPATPEPETSWGTPSTEPDATVSMPAAGAAAGAAAGGAAGPPTEPTYGTPPPSEPPKKSGGNLPALILGGVLLLALIGAGAWLLLGGDDDGDDSQAVSDVGTTETSDAGDGSSSGDLSGSDALMELFVQQMVQGSDLSEDQARCFSENLLNNDDFDFEELANNPDALAGDFDAMRAILDIFETCDIDPTTLGGFESDPSSDADTYGDDPTLDALWDDCEAGDGQACDDLFWQSPVGSEYEEFGDTCGGRFEAGTVFCANEDLG